jgi:hypothetical protein
MIFRIPGELSSFSERPSQVAIANPLAFTFRYQDVLWVSKDARVMGFVTGNLSIVLPFFSISCRFRGICFKSMC